VTAAAKPECSCPTLSRFATVAEVAESLGVSRHHVYGMLSDGALPYIDVSRRGEKTKRPKIRIPVAKVNEYLERNTRTAPRAVAS
jgi:excisionase family DNA binding protein